MYAKMSAGAVMIGLMLINPSTSIAANSRTGTHSEADSSHTTIQGVATLSNPLAHATIRVIDPFGKIIAEQADTTSVDGYFSITVPAAAEREELKIEAIGGQSGGSEFRGTLIGSLDCNEGSGSEPGDRFVHLNAATTLAAYYRQAKPDTTEAEGDERVKSFLELPAQLDLGFGIENPYDTFFSSAAFESAANGASGWDPYMIQLAGEMAGSETAIQAFPAPESGITPNPLNPYAVWVGEKLLSGVVGAIGSEMFSQFLAGVGMGDQTQSQIFGLLNQVMARLVEIQNSLNRIEQAIQQSNYDVRASALWKQYAQLVTIMDQIRETNLRARANTGPDGKPKDPVIAKQVKAAGESYRQQILSLGSKLVSDVHAEMLSEGTITPLPKVFSTARWLAMKPVISTEYFKLVWGQLEQYRSFQAVSTALLVDALFVDNEVEATSVRNVAVKYINEEKVIYPDEPFFQSRYVDSVLQGKAVFDTNMNRVWDLSYAHFNTCQEVFNQIEHPQGDYRLPELEQIRNLISDAKLSGRYSDVAKKLGFSSAEVDAVKMITVLCVPNTPAGNLYVWFGYDRSGPWDPYGDPEGQFDLVRRQFGMTGIYTLKTHTLP